MHENWTDIVAGIAKSSWGRDFASPEEAERFLLNDKQSLSAFASVELLRRLERIADALGSRNQKKEPRVHLPEDAASMPAVNIGDRLYSYECDGGMFEYIVVAKDELHRCMIVLMNDFDLRWGPVTRIATDEHTTPEAAMRAGALEFVSSWADELEFAKNLLVALDANQPLDKFLGGVDEQEHNDE